MLIELFSHNVPLNTIIYHFQALHNSFEKKFIHRANFCIKKQPLRLQRIDFFLIL